MPKHDECNRKRMQVHVLAFSNDAKHAKYDIEYEYDIEYDINNGNEQEHEKDSEHDLDRDNGAPGCETGRTAPPVGGGGG